MLQDHPRRPGLSEEHVHDLSGRAIAEHLAPMFLVHSNAMFGHETHEVCRRVSGQRATNEIGVSREEVRGTTASVGEIAAAPTADANLLAKLGGVVDGHHPEPALAKQACAEQARSACAHHRHICCCHTAPSIHL